MNLLGLVRRLLVISGLQMIAAITISVLTHDTWMVVSLVASVASVASGVIAAIAVLLLIVAGLRRLAANRPVVPRPDETILPHEQGLTGLHETSAAGPERNAVSDGL